MKIQAIIVESWNRSQKLVEQVNTGPGDDGLNGLFGSNQDETMRIDSNMEKLLKRMQQILHPKKYISSHFCT